jgi:hypothetical protein
MAPTRDWRTDGTDRLKRLFTQAGVVVAVAGTATDAPVGIASALASTKPTSELNLMPQEDLGVGEELVAPVQNARIEEINLFIGQKATTIHDRKVAARLVRTIR